MSYMDFDCFDDFASLSFFYPNEYMTGVGPTMACAVRPCNVLSKKKKQHTHTHKGTTKIQRRKEKHLVDESFS